MRFQSNLNEIIEADETLKGQLTIPQMTHMESHNTVSFFQKTLQTWILDHAGNSL